MKWANAQRALNRATQTVFGEDAIVRGIVISAVFVDEFIDGLGIASSGPAVKLLNEDVVRINLKRGDSIEVRERRFIVKEIEPNQTTGRTFVLLSE